MLLRPVSESDLSVEPELSGSTLAAFEAEIAHDRKAGSLRKLGDHPAEAIVALKRLPSKRK